MAGYVGDLGSGERAFCSHCLRSLWENTRCKRRDCPGYAPIYLRDRAERILVNLAAWGGKTCLVTLTARGKDVLPWDRLKCPSGEHHCSGWAGCRVNWVAAAHWNSTVTRRLSELLKVARERTRRKHGRDARVEVLVYVCEAQQRGVFHPHVVLGYRTAADRAALETFRKALRRKRGAYGFGTGRKSFDGGKPDRFNALDAARYVSKYLRPDGAKTSFVPLLEHVSRVTPRNEETGRQKFLLRPVYVSPVLTKRTGVTMGFLRFRRWIWSAWGDGLQHRELLLVYWLYRKFGATLGDAVPRRLPTRAPPQHPTRETDRESIGSPLRSRPVEQLALPF